MNSAPEIITPEGLSLLSYQAEGVRHLLSHPVALLADEQGLGKTVQVATALNHAAPGAKIFIGCPAHLVLNWVHELKKWTAPRGFSVGMATPDRVPETDITVAHYDILPRISGTLCTRRWDIAVLDEAHRIKNPEAKTTAAAHCIMAPWRWALTGTPIPNKPREAWSLINWLLSGHYMPYKDYTRHYCAGHLREQVCKFRNKKTGKMDSRKRKIWEDGGASNLDHLHGVLVSATGMIRRKKADVLQDLPAKVRQVLEILPPRGVLKGESSAVQAVGGYEEALARIQGGAPVGFEDWARVRAELALAKIPHALEVLEDLLRGQEKVVVFCHHREVALTLYARLKEYNPALAIGGEGVNGAVYQFQTDPSCRVIVGNDVIREGVTLTAAQVGLFVELDPVPGNMDQMEDRLHRIGQTGSVLILALVFSGSLDAHLLRILWNKRRVISQAVEGMKQTKGGPTMGPL